MVNNTVLRKRELTFEEVAHVSGGLSFWADVQLLDAARPTHINLDNLPAAVSDTTAAPSVDQRGVDALIVDGEQTVTQDDVATADFSDAIEHTWRGWRFLDR